MVDLLDAAHALHRFMQAPGWHYRFIGGFALQQWGEARLILGRRVASRRIVQNRQTALGFLPARPPCAGVVILAG